MTTEQKAKAYDEALERASKLRVQNPFDTVSQMMEYVFPELAESEDEKIREDIIALLHFGLTDGSSVAPGRRTTKEQAITWLEKQDSCYTFEIKKGHWYRCVCDYMLNGSILMFKNDKLYYCRRDWRLRGEVDERNVKDIGINGYKSFFRPATNQEIKDWLENKIDKNFVPIDKVVNFLNDELTNDKDEITGEPFINFNNYGAFKESFISYFKRKMLEKQGEKSPNILRGVNEDLPVITTSSPIDT